MNPRNGPYRRWRLQSGQGVRVRMGGRVYINFGTDDYLDLATDPRVAAAAARAVHRYGFGGGASHRFSGYLPPHRALERALARHEETDGALVCESTAVAARVLIGSLVGPDDAIFCDARAGGDLADGCQLSRAPTHRYRHADLDHLEMTLDDAGGRVRRRLIVTDAVFGAVGDAAPLDGIGDLAERYQALVVVDESNAFGVLGERGRGLTDDLSLRASTRHRFCKMGSLQKALGSQGGFVCGPRRLLALIARHPRLATAGGVLAVPAAAAARRALALAEAEPDRRRRALAQAGRLRDLLRQRGIPTTPAATHIVCVPAGTSRLAARLSRRLEIMGLLVPAICPPLVPRGAALLRIILTAGHTDTEVDRLVEALTEVRAAVVV